MPESFTSTLTSSFLGLYSPPRRIRVLAISLTRTITQKCYNAHWGKENHRKTFSKRHFDIPGKATGSEYNPSLVPDKGYIKRTGSTKQNDIATARHRKQKDQAMIGQTGEDEDVGGIILFSQSVFTHMGLARQTEDWKMKIVCFVFFSFSHFADIWQWSAKQAVIAWPVFVKQKLY